MDALVILIPLLPLLAAATIGFGLLFGALPRGRRETVSADLAVWSLVLACLMAFALLAGDLLGKNHGYFSVGQWLSSDSLTIRVNFTTSGLNVWMAALWALLLALMEHFAIAKLRHTEGLHRFCGLLALFTAGVLLAALSANMVGTLCGWWLAELAGCFLVAHHYQQAANTENATRVLLGQRVGDIGFLLGISLAYVWTDSVNWAQLQASASELSIGQATGISLCFAFAAFAKAGLVPFTPWLVRTLDEPAPVSLLLIHVGVFLVVTLETVFMESPFARAVLGLAGFATAVYGYIVGKTQNALHSAFLFAALAQVGLMFVECALGLWTLASWHLAANVTVACLQRLMVANTRTTASVPPRLVPVRLYLVSWQQFWLEHITDWALVKPVQGLAHDLSYVDDRIIDRMIGLPSAGVLPPKPTDEPDMPPVLVQGTGLVGKLTQSLSAGLHWIEERLVLRGPSTHISGQMRQLGHIVNEFEAVILRPRYLVLFVFITFLVAF